MSDLIRAVQSRADIIRAVVYTPTFQLEGDIHCPKLGKEGRRLSNVLNSDRSFIAVTNVSIIDRNTGVRDAKTYPLIQVCLKSIEFIRPYLDEGEIAAESEGTLSQSSVS